MANPIDIRVGALIRRRRLELYINQVALAKALGIKPQQVQKYESGLNRVSASRLWEIARVLDVPIDFFFGVDAQAEQRQCLNKPSNSEEGAELIRNYYAMTEVQRQKIFELARAMAVTDGGVKPRRDRHPKKKDDTNTSD